MPMRHDPTSRGASQSREGRAHRHPERQRTLVGRRAAKLVKQGDVVGLGTGRTASEFIIALGGRIKREGLQITAVSSSTRSTDLAQANGIFVRPIADVAHIDIAVDGADEVDPASDLVKGRGGALLRERQVAQKSKRLVIMVDAAKFVPALGKGTIPVKFAGPVRRPRKHALRRWAKVPRCASTKTARRLSPTMATTWLMLP